jgi:asparagine synthetase B (glutamine-hydrolysing)
MNFKFQIKLPLDLAAVTSFPDLQQYLQIQGADEDIEIHTGSSGNRLFWIGDLVLPEGIHSRKQFFSRILESFDINLLLSAGGFYYVILFSDHNKRVVICTGLFNVLPIFYFCDDDHVVISSSIEKIVSELKQKLRFSKRFILEKLLFNYSFGNETIYDTVKMVPGNHYLKIDSEGMHVCRHTSMCDWLCPSPICSKTAYRELAAFFNQRVSRYLPDDFYFLSFTSGFDGRSLLSAALKKHKNFQTFSFGSSSAEDVVMPRDQAELFGIDHQSFCLDTTPYLDQSFAASRELVKLTACMANFSRAHYLYAVKQVSRKTNCMITGNFGSELFRAAHLTGVMISPFLYEIFAAKNLEHFLDNYSYPEMDFLQKDRFQGELDDLKQEIMSCEILKNNELSLNQKFSIFMYEEIFRKYFGPEIVMQSNYVKNRSPYLDLAFIQELFKTDLAGIYRNFYDKNPVNRFKGQLLYAYIIQQNSNALHKMNTGKGYRPSDLQSVWGKGNIVYGYVKKKLLPRNVEKDPFAVQKAFQFNQAKLSGIEIRDSLFNKAKIQNAMGHHDPELNNLVNVLSLNWYMNYAG